MPETGIKGIGGWLKDADAGFSRAGRRLEDIDIDDLNPQYLAYFGDYRTRYFNDRLVPNQGAEEILAMLRDHGGAPRRWIDLGAGVTTLFWSIGVNTPQEISVGDLVPEALHVLAAFKESDELPPCYRDALSFTGRSDAEFSRTRSLPWNYHVLDCLVPWAIDGDGSGYDLITAIGCFGLAADAEHYSTAFLAAVKNLSPTGRLIGADWVRSRMFIDLEGHDNRYLSEPLGADNVTEAGLVPLARRKIAIEGDPYYDSVIVWAYGRHE